MSSSWDLVGNGGTNGQANFLGTADMQPVRIRTANIQRLQVDADGSFTTTLRLNTSFLLKHQGVGGLPDFPHVFSGEWAISTATGDLTFSSTRKGNVVVKSSQLLIDRAGDWNSSDPSIDGESLVVKHSENGLAPGVTFVNDGGGHFVQQFVFTNQSANLPGGVAANLWGNWRGLTITGQRNLSFVLGSIADATNVPEDGRFVFAGGDLHVKSSIYVDGDVLFQNGADCAEDFDIAGELPEPGTVLVMSPCGDLEPCVSAYDKRVAGVVSGAGDHRPAITFDRKASLKNRRPVALVGKVYCKVDAEYGAIEAGDLLTTSPTAGHAMKAADSSRAFGAVIGKSLRPWSKGEGMVPILVSLQ